MAIKAVPARLPDAITPCNAMRLTRLTRAGSRAGRVACAALVALAPKARASVAASGALADGLPAPATTAGVLSAGLLWNFNTQ